MNLSIPDAAAHLAVSETRLRRTLSERSTPTQTELRQTRTGVRKTTVLSPSAIEALRTHFASRAATEAPCDAIEPPNRHMAVGDESMASVPRFPEPCVTAAVAVAQTVPVSQFNALLFQHNVLREELSRVTEYLDGCDRLLGEMVRTISTLEERTRPTTPSRVVRMDLRSPLAAALRSVRSNVQNVLFTRTARSGEACWDSAPAGS